MVLEDHHEDEGNVGEEHLKHPRVDLLAGDQVKAALSGHTSVIVLHAVHLQVVSQTEPLSTSDR